MSNLPLSDIERGDTRRAVLFSARLRFSSPVQPIREGATDRIVSQTLALSDPEVLVSPEELFRQGAFSLPDGAEILTPDQVRLSLERLVKEQQVEGDPASGVSLTESARATLEKEMKRGQDLFDRVIAKHLKGARGDFSRNKDVFVRSVATVFVQLGEIYVKAILGEIHEIDFARGPLLKRVLDEVDSADCDAASVKSGLVSFIEDVTPDSAHVKWNLAQNYYIAKALGLDEGGRLLSEEAFGDAEIYLDTNIVIPALESGFRRHKDFLTLASACKGVDAGLFVCHPTIQETKASIESRRDTLEKIIHEVPEPLEERIVDDLFHIARRKLRETGELDLDDLFAPYEDAAAELESRFNVQLVDDKWFQDAQDSAEIKQIAELVSDAWRKRTGRPKPRLVALHDALLLAWIAKRRSEESVKTVLLVTSDHTLPDVVVGEGEERPRVMMLDAFIQWVSPLALRAKPTTDFSAIFADAIKYELLPHENFLDPRDFLVFHEMEMSCKELPVEDVEECLDHIKKHMGHLDPRRAEDREKLTAEINRFLVSPGRKYRLELERLEREKAHLEDQSRRQLKEQGQQSAEALREREEEIEKKSKEVSTLRRAAADSAKKADREKLRRSAFWRLAPLALLLLAALAGVIYFALDSAAEGTPVFSTISSALPPLGLLFLIWLGLVWLVLGRERIRSLGWATQKIFRSDDQ